MKKIPKKIILIIIVLFIIFAVFFNQTYGSKVFDLVKLQSFVKDLGIFGPIILIFLLAFQGVFSIFPATILFVLAGTSFGILLGTLYCLIGTLLGAGIAFKIAKKYGKKIECYLLSKKNADEIINFTKDSRGYLTSIGRMIPLLPIDVISFSAGIEKMKFGKFLWTSAIGFLVPILLFLFLGEILVKQSLLILTGLAVLSLIGIFILEQNHHKILRFFLKKNKK